MLPFRQALSRVLAGAEPLGSERVELRRAAGRVLSERVVAGVPLPRFDYSAMDGYALATSELGDRDPARLPTSGESRAGGEPPEHRPGHACRIFTGAALPGWADAVVIQEDVEVQGDHILLKERPAPGDHVRRRGEDLARGGVALEPGRRLSAFDLALCASLDRTSLCVGRRPRVSVICTGDELRVPGAPGLPSSIPESNGLCVAVECERAGARAELSPLCADDPEALARTLADALSSSDLLVTIGGVSVGRYDVVRPALEAAGARLDFWKVAIKPGKPLVYGRAGRTHVLGLPGNPVSAQLTFALFGLPLLRALSGERERAPRFRTARLASAISQRPGRLSFYRGRFTEEGVAPVGNQASGNVVSLTLADVLIAVPAESNGYAAGDQVEYLELRDL
jgi:molybdopterin molybdotransferase